MRRKTCRGCLCGWLPVGIVVLSLIPTASAASAQPPTKTAPCGWSTVWTDVNAPFASLPKGATITDAKLKRAASIETASIVFHQLEGVWQVELIVDQTGAVRDAHIVSRPQMDTPWPAYEEAILKSVKLWAYVPALVDGRHRPHCIGLTVAAPASLMVREFAGISLPVLLKDVKPQYTAMGMKARIEGRVLMEVLGLENGRVGTVRVLRSLDTVHGLDDAEAVKALRQWRFAPGMKDGEPVQVMMTVEMAFTMR